MGNTHLFFCIPDWKLMNIYIEINKKETKININHGPIKPSQGLA